MTVEQGAAPAGGRRTLLPHSGGAGAPPGGTKAPCQELADDELLPVERIMGKARPGAGVRTPRWRAERRGAFDKKAST